MKHRLTAPLFAVLVLALAAFTGSALAGGSGANGSDGSNGNSANAPGQTKADQTPGRSGPLLRQARPKLTRLRPPRPLRARRTTSRARPSVAAPATGGSKYDGRQAVEHDRSRHLCDGVVRQDQGPMATARPPGQIATQAGHANAVPARPGQQPAAQDGALPRRP